MSNHSRVGFTANSRRATIFIIATNRRFMSTSSIKLMSSLKHLGDVTSRDLEFSYRSDVPVSYGEETITESNLLKLRRRHSDVIQLRTFSKHQESKMGADWEWYLVGHRRTLRMRVQAKRVQRNGVLKIRHTVGQSGLQQRDLLIQAAHADRMRPMYCIYCTESQRCLWRQRGRYQTGCLLADVRNVPLHTRSLHSIERACWPWHYLFEALPPLMRIDYLFPRGEAEQKGHELPLSQPLDWDVPTILDLNEDSEREYDRTGVKATTPLDLARVAADSTEEAQWAAEYDRERRLDEGARRIVAIDVRAVNPEHRRS